MKKVFLLIIALATFSIGSLAYSKTYEGNASKFIKKDLKSNYTQSSEIMVFDLNTSEAKNVFNNENSRLLLKNFPIGINIFANISVSKNRSVVTEDTKVIVNQGTNAQRFGSIPEVVTYYGKIDGQPNSMVFLSYTSSGLIGTIRDEFGTDMNLSMDPKVKANDTQSIKHYITLNDNSIFKEMGAKICGAVEENLNIPKRDKESKENEIQANRMLVANMALEATTEFVELFQNDTAKVKNYMISVLSFASRIYEEELNVLLQVGNMYYYDVDNSDKDPYLVFYVPKADNKTKTKDLGDYLGYMPTAWGTRANVSRTFAVLFHDVSRQMPGSIILGIAMGGAPKIGNFCSKERGYCVIGMSGNVKFPTLSFTQDVQVAAHEIGHTFGSPHTHSCAWPSIDGGPIIDSCVTSKDSKGDADCLKDADRRSVLGTIMSYCHFGPYGIAYTFGPRVISILKTGVNSAYKNTLCLKEPTSPTLRLLSPLGNELLNGGLKENIRWTSSKVSKINIFYSIDNGKNWLLIDTANSAKDTVYSWNVPIIASKTTLVKIESFTDTKVYDQSVLPFDIRSKGITVTSPTESERVGYITTKTLAWNRSATDFNVNIEYSLDKGTKWNTITTNSNASTFDFNFPDTSIACMVKFYDANDKNTSVIRNITLAKEYLDFVSPKAGDFVCDTNSNFTYYWKQDLLDKVKLQYSVDKGNAWKNVSITGIDAKLGMYKWNNSAWLPNKCVQLRAVNVSDLNIVYGFADCFEVVNCVTSVNEEFNSLLSIDEIVPNPSNGEFQINFTSKNNLDEISLNIFNTKGELMQFLGHFHNINAGINTYNLSENNLPSGTYYLMITSGINKVSKKLNILK